MRGFAPLLCLGRIKSARWLLPNLHYIHEVLILKQYDVGTDIIVPILPMEKDDLVENQSAELVAIPHGFLQTSSINKNVSKSISQKREVIKCK